MYKIGEIYHSYGIHSESWIILRPEMYMGGLFLDKNGIIVNYPKYKPNSFREAVSILRTYYKARKFKSEPNATYFEISRK